MASSKKERDRWQVLYTVSSCVRKWGIKKASCPLYHGGRKNKGRYWCLYDARLKPPVEEAVCKVETFKRTLVAIEIYVS